MSVITRVPEPNLWHLICKEYAGRCSSPEEETHSVSTDYQDFDPSKHHPVFYGKMHERISTDNDNMLDFDVALSHPACLGFAFVEKPPRSPSPLPPPPPPKDTCTPREYLENYIFPILLPALAEMLKQAKLEKCFERKRTKFNALDFITEYLYKNNKNAVDRENVVLWDIPFVKEWLKDHPRPPLPLSLIWTEEEAAVKIQSYWRGYKERCDPEIQELRQWQKEWREENQGYGRKVSEFWEAKMPDSGDLQEDDREEQKCNTADKSSPAEQTTSAEQVTDNNNTEVDRTQPQI